MIVVRPNCRVQFTAEDIAFILAVVGSTTGSNDKLLQLLGEDETRDLVLDDASLFHAVLEGQGCLRISTHFYFYLLVRNSFQRLGLEDRILADYVASVLAEFSKIERTRCVVDGQSLDYFFEMLAALPTADDATGFYIRAHVGNQSLILSGVYPDHVRFRAERRGAPDVTYYEGLGRTNFRVASDHRLAREYDLDSVFILLADRFQDARLALNDLRDRLICLGDPDYSNLLGH